MLELIAQGPELLQRWRNSLPAGATFTVGRDEQADFPVPWDPHLSRLHLRITVDEQALTVAKLPAARNGLFYDGREVECCRPPVGKHFVAGSTVFYVSEQHVEIGSGAAPPVEEVTFSSQQLKQHRFHDAERRIEVLMHLPQVIGGAPSDAELYERMGNLLLSGVVHSDAVAVVSCAAGDEVELHHWDRRLQTAGEFRPSRRLVRDALRKQGGTVLHIWDQQEQSDPERTLVQEFDWAYCTPIPGGKDEAWGLYVAGRLGESPVPATTLAESVQLESDIKFTELVAEIVGALRRSHQLERRHASYRQFLSPTILATLGDDLNNPLLEPRECDVTVMFCDLRGFSQQAEEAADDLIGLLDRVSRALEVMTQNMLTFGGVTGEFLGDAILGFWGWPFTSDEAPLNACRAALGIRAAFARTSAQRDHPLANFRVGIGVAHGRAVAGKIGTSDQVKFTVFGPVVNLASRLENMTKQLRVPILLDEALASIVRPRLATGAEGRIRRLARVQPYGIETPVVVSELLPPLSENPELTDAQLEQYEKGVEHFLEGRWEEAYHCLHAMPASDRAQDFLAQMITQHNRVAPPGWDGVVRLPSK